MVAAGFVDRTKHGIQNKIIRQSTLGVYTHGVYEIIERILNGGMIKDAVASFQF